MESFGVPRKLVSLTRTSMLNSKATVMIGGRMSRIFKVPTGVRQGDVLSALLFNIALHKLMQNLDVNENIIYMPTQVHAYADDIHLVARSMATHVKVIQNLERLGCQIELNINKENEKL